jgi:hypothetical protein
MSSDLTAEITAISTATLAVFAFITAILAGLAFRKQSREVRDQAKMLRIESEQFAEQRKLNAEQAKVLELQATELRESLEERKRAQAARVFIGATWHPEDPEWDDPGFFTPRVVNGSDFPAYDTQIWYPSDTDHAYTSGTVLPGEQADPKEQGHGFSSAQDAIGSVVLTFHDVAGVRWVRMPDGTLNEQTRDTARESVLAALGVPIPESVGHEDQRQRNIPRK